MRTFNSVCKVPFSLQQKAQYSHKEMCLKWQNVFINALPQFYSGGQELVCRVPCDGAGGEVKNRVPQNWAPENNIIQI